MGLIMNIEYYRKLSIKKSERKKSRATKRFMRMVHRQVFVASLFGNNEIRYGKDLHPIVEHRLSIASEDIIKQLMSEGFDIDAPIGGYAPLMIIRW